jgi:hypothetical protein
MCCERTVFETPQYVRCGLKTSQVGNTTYAITTVAIGLSLLRGMYIPVV